MAGLLVGHTEAIVTGALAGYDAVQWAKGEPLLELSRKTAIGEAIAYVKEQMATEKGMGLKYTFSGSTLFEHMKELDLYETDVEAITNRVKEAGLYQVFAPKGGQ